VIDFLAQGGVIMIPIGICSILALAFTAERAWFLWEAHVPTETFWGDVELSLQQGDFEDVLAVTQRYPDGILAQLVETGVDVRPRTPERGVEAMEEYGLQRVPELDRFLPALNFIAQVSPLLGLLGTVAGMIETFSVIAESGVGQPELLAGGISKALITTATGLTVGIVTLFFHHLISRQVDRVTHAMEVGTRRVEEALKNHADGDEQGHD
jgi:biopolymer transport protein ExbB